MADLESLSSENAELKARLAETEGLLAAIQSGMVDGVVAGDSRVLSSDAVGHSYMVLLETMGDGAATLTASGTILSCNGRLARMLGLPESAVPGVRFFEFFPPEEGERLSGLLSRMDSEGARGEFTMKDGAGKSLPVLISCSSLKPKVDAFGVVVTDLTAQKRAGAQLEQSEAKYRSLFDRAFDAFLLLELDPDGTPIVVDANQSALRMHGFSREEVIGKPLSFLDAEDAPESLLRQRTEHLRSSSGAIFEAHHRRKDGQRLDLEVSIQKVEFDGRSLHLDIARDITGRKQSEHALRTSMEEFRSLAEAMPQIVWVTRPDGWNIFFNQQWTDYTGLTLEESMGHGWNKPFHPDDQQRAWDAWQKATKESATYSLESRLRRWDGTYRWWLVRGVPLRDAAGTILKWYGTCTDIHDLKTAEADRAEMRTQLQQAQKMESVGRLAGGVAHDFNNLLTAITGYAGFVRESLPPGNPVREDVGEILAAADRAAALTRQLLAFSRRQILRLRVLDINDVVGAELKMIRRLIGEDVVIEARLAAYPCRVMADSGQLGQVLLNLAVNARDAMPKGGTLALSTGVVAMTPDFFRPETGLRPGPLVLLRVSDTGSGMSDEVRARIFEPFFTTKEQGKGTGLGLSTVYGIIKQSGGDIQLETAPGSGTTFRIYLPQADSARMVEDEDKDKHGAGSLRGQETVLLVEDEDVLRRLGERALTASGYTVLFAGNGAEALEVVGRHGKPVDLLVTDVVMPGMSGRDLARALAERHMVRRTLFITGFTDDAIVTHGVLEPGLALLNKPFSPEALLRKMREVLDGPTDQAKP